MHTYFNPFPQKSEDEYRAHAMAIEASFQVVATAMAQLQKVMTEHVPPMVRHHARFKDDTKRTVKDINASLRKAIASVNEAGMDQIKAVGLEIDRLRTQNFETLRVAKLAEQRRLREMEVHTDEQGRTFQIRETDGVDPVTGLAVINTRKVFVDHEQIMRQQDEASRMARSRIL